VKRGSAPHFLDGGGELGALMRAKDWSATPLGPIDTWPQSLRTSVSILLNSRYPMFIFWGPQHIKIYNDGYRPITGDKHPWALGRPGTEVWPEIWDAIGPMVERVVQHGEATWSDDLQLFMHRRGFPEEVFFTFSYSPIRDESGGIGGMFCACTETTVKVQGERRLKLLRDLAAAPVEARSVADACRLSVDLLAGNRADIPFALLYLFEQDGPVLAAAAGTAAEDVAGDWPLDARAEVSELPARFRRVPAGPWPEPPSRAMVLPLVDHAQDKPTGALVLGISSRALFDDAYRDFFGLVAGQLAASLANARASEEERRRAQALAEIDRAKTAFFSNVSHEFRTPLTLMLGPVDDLLADAERPLAPGQREQLELVRRNGLRLQKLVNALLDFSRIEAGRAQASYAPTDLAALTADIASTFRSTIERAGLRLVVDCPSLPEPAYVDADMWEKVVLNLLSNAFKFTFAGEIEVALRRGAEGFELKVRDTGTGIPPAELPRMFERFHRIAGARGRTHEGTGIGLALVQELVRLHRGSIAVDSTPGAGTVFTVRIPAGKAHLPADKLGVARPAASTARGAELFAGEVLRWQPDAALLPGDAQPARRERIVWADDNADMRDYVRRLLSARYEVEAVADGEAALAAARARRPDLVLADVMMPALDGLGLARALRADPHTRSIPIILLSARAGAESRIEGLDAGADDYLYKPFSARELLAQVAARLELSRLQARLQQERAELANLFQQTPVPTAVLQGSELVFEMANPAYLAVVGGRDILGKPLLEALPEARGQGFDELLREVMRTGQPHIGHETPVRLEHEGRVKERYFTFIYAPLRGAGGEIDRVIAIVNEVTEQVQARKQIERLAAEATAELAERQRAQAALGQSEGKYRTLFESIDEGFCVAEVMFDERGAASDYRFLEVNPAFERHTGLVNAVGRTARQLIPGHDEFWFTTYASVALTGEATRFEHYAAAMGRWFDVFCTRIGPSQEHRVAIVFNDVTKRKAAESALKEADRRKDEFLATLAHELRNPLAPISNAVNLLQQADGDALVRQRAQSILARQVDHMIRLVDDLLDIARVSRGRISLQRQAVRLDAVIESAVETSRPLVEAGGHRLSIELPQEPVMLCGDALRLAQVIANLLNNAAKYTPRAGRIAVSARSEPGWVSVAVRDDGIGIEPESLPRLFEMFGRVDSARQRAPGGLGIGLALARQLVELHGGRIEARSRGAGLGSEFIVRLPTLDAEPAHAVPPPAEPVSSERRRVLVVDDNADAAAALGMVLEQMGHTVEIAHDGASALHAARQDPPEIILADLDLPGLDGFGLATRLREDRRFDGVPIIAVSGFGQEDDRRRTRQAGFDEHLVKPVDVGVLRTALQLIDWKSL
jgi:PAS domain S-box-containing protein